MQAKLVWQQGQMSVSGIRPFGESSVGFTTPAAAWMLSLKPVSQLLITCTCTGCIP